MKIYLVEQNSCTGYDTYDSFVIICDNEEEARLTHPWGWFNDGRWNRISKDEDSSDWAGELRIDSIKVTYLGEAKEGSNKEVVCSSYNAG